MANLNAPSGLRPVMWNGNAWNGQMKMINLPASYGTAVFLGDPVVLTGAADAYGVPQATLATAGSSHYISGAVIGFCNGPSAGGNATSTLLQNTAVYGLASTNRYCMIVDDPNTLFEIQEDSSGGSIAAGTSAGNNANLVAGSGGSTVTGYSSWQLQSSSVNTTNTLQVQIIGLARGPDNAIGNFAKWYVRLNLAQLWNLTGV